MAGHCERGMRGLLPSSLGWQHRQVRFALRQEDHQSYCFDDESLLMSRWKTKSYLPGGAEIRNDWMLE